MSFDDLKRTVLDVNVSLVKSGLVVLTWGNASGVDRKADGGRGVMAIKPSGVDYETLRPDDIVVVSLASGKVIEGSKRPSSDTLTHLELYREFANVGGIVHTHSLHATAFAQAGCEISCLGTTHADHFYGTVPVTRALTADEINGEYELNTGKVIAERFRSGKINPDEMPAVLVAGHAPFVWGGTPKQALENAIALEYVARMQVETWQINAQIKGDSRLNAISQLLLDKHFLRKHGPAATYGQAEKK
jgi:L-ribulose-5-phosphate 4-epimerase